MIDDLIDPRETVIGPRVVTMSLERFNWVYQYDMQFYYERAYLDLKRNEEAKLMPVAAMGVCEQSILNTLQRKYKLQDRHRGTFDPRKDMIYEDFYTGKYLVPTDGMLGKPLDNRAK